MKDKELKALITLLNDPDPVVSEEVERNLMNRGVDVVPDLERAWEHSLDKDVQSRLENIIDDIQFATTRNGLRKWYANGARDLIEGAYWLANFQYPELKLSDVMHLVEQLEQELQNHLVNSLTPLENIRAVNHVFFRVNKFNGNKSNFFTPQNFYINNVFERKKGNPLSLGLLYSALCQRLGLPVYGVDLPVNYLLGYYNTTKPETARRRDILFYINPYSFGSPLSNKDLDYFLKRQKLTTQQENYQAVSNAHVIVRLLNNLIFAYDKLGFPEKSKALSELRKILAYSENP